MSKSSDLDWFLANDKPLLEKYPDHWLAIKDGKVRAFASRPKELRLQVEALGLTGHIVVRSALGSTEVRR